MDQLSDFIIDIQQIFLGLLTLGFSYYIYQERSEVQTILSRGSRKFLTLIFVCCFIGLSINFLQALGQTGIIYALEFSLLVTLSLFGGKA